MVRPTAEKKAPQPDVGGSTGPRKNPWGTRPQREECKEIAALSETSDNEGSVAKSRHDGSRQLEDQMAKMAKELEELRKGKQRGTRKNPSGEMNAPFSRRIREAELPPKFKMPAEKYFGSEDPVSHMESFVHHMEVQNATRSAMCRMFPSTLNDCGFIYKTYYTFLCLVSGDQTSSQGPHPTVVCDPGSG